MNPVKFFGGFHSVYGLLESYGVKNKIDTILWRRDSNTKYSLSDVLLSHFCSVMSGGTALEDGQKMRFELSDVAGSDLPSSDTLSPKAVKTFAHSHDRFLIIDQKELYHLGASLKDLGKKWFAFSKMDSLVAEVSEELRG